MPLIHPDGSKRGWPHYCCISVNAHIYLFKLVVRNISATGDIREKLLLVDQRRFGATTQAGSEAGFSRGGSGGKMEYVLFFGGADWADRSAIDARALHTDEEPPIKASVA